MLKHHNIFKHKKVEESKIFKQMLLFGLPLIIANTGGIFISQFDTLMLTTLKDLETVGIYNIAISSALLLSFIYNALSVTLIPTISEMSERKQVKEIKKGIEKMYKYTFISLTPILLIGIIFAKELLSFVYGTEYGIGYNAFRILLIGMIFVIINNYNIRILIGLGKTKTIAKITWLSAILNIVLNVPLIYYFGFIGAATASSISYFVQMFLTNKQVLKIVGDNNL